MTLRVLVVDDEPLARQRLRDLLEKEPDVEIAGEAASGPEAVESIRKERPDLVFLDVQMPGLSGIEVASEVGADAMPATIFVTAFDEYAVRAFELAAVDYLVKPFDDERFEQAFRRARRRVEPEPRYLDRIAVDTRGQTRVIPVAKIDYITASGAYAELHVGDATFAVRERMQALEERLDPRRFARIHRSTIVRLDLVDALLRAGGGDYAVRLRNGVELAVSRGKREELERKLVRGR